MQLFNRPLHRLRRNRVASQFHQVDFLLHEVSARLADRLLDIQKEFPLSAEIGCHTGILAKHLANDKVKTLIQTDISEEMLRQTVPSLAVVADEEFLPFRDNSLDAIFSVFSLHWVNDLPGCLIQCQRALKPDGLLLAAVPGPKTLQELRESILAVSTLHGKLSPRISPFVEVRDAGGLLQRAGYALPVVDNETLTVNYSDPLKMLQELKAMGETNALLQQHKGLTGKHFWPEVLDYYQSHYALPDGRFPVTVEVIFITGWKPHASQQQPAKRGSGKVMLTDFFAGSNKAT